MGNGRGNWRRLEIAAAALAFLCFIPSCNREWPQSWFFFFSSEYSAHSLLVAGGRHAQVSGIIREFRNRAQPFQSISGPDAVDGEWTVETLLKSQLYPQLAQLSLAEMKEVFKASKSCGPDTPMREFAREQDKRHSSPLQRKLAEWQALRCSQDHPQLLLRLSEQPAMHPAGHSFARMALDEGWLKQEDVYQNTTLRRRFHIDERAALFGSKLSTAETLLAALTASEREALVLGNELVLSQTAIWLLDDKPQSRYLLFSRGDWEKFLDQNFWTASVYTDASRCEYTDFGLCWNVKPLPGHLQWLGKVLPILVLSLLALVFFFVLKIIQNQRAVAKDRLLIMRTMAHEIRTPVAGLQLGIDRVREEWDQLSPPGQQALLAILKESGRLSKLARDGVDYLALIQKRTAISPKLSQVDQPELWFQDLVKELAPEFGFEVSGRSTVGYHLVADRRWLEIIVTNLVRNSLAHGGPPYRAKFSFVGHQAIFEVADGGRWKQSRRYRLASLLRRTHDPNGGLGLGLWICRQAARQIGAKIRISHKPTRVSLVIPLRRSP